MKKVETALDTFKGDNESWTDVFARVNTEAGVDHKTMIKVIISILEVLDDQEKRIVKRVPIYSDQPVFKPSLDPRLEPKVELPKQEKPVLGDDSGIKADTEAGTGDKTNNQT